MSPGRAPLASKHGPGTINSLVDHGGRHRHPLGRRRGRDPAALLACGHDRLRDVGPPSAAPRFGPRQWHVDHDDLVDPQHRPDRIDIDHSRVRCAPGHLCGRSRKGRSPRSSVLLQQPGSGRLCTTATRLVAWGRHRATDALALVDDAGRFDHDRRVDAEALRPDRHQRDPLVEAVTVGPAHREIGGLEGVAGLVDHRVRDDHRNIALADRIEFGQHNIDQTFLEVFDPHDDRRIAVIATGWAAATPAPHGAGPGWRATWRPEIR